MAEILKRSYSPMYDRPSNPITAARKLYMPNDDTDENDDRNVDSLKQYLNDIRGFRLLKPEEEPQLAKIIEKGRIAISILTPPGLTDSQNSKLPLVGTKSVADILPDDALRYIEELGLSMDEINLFVKKKVKTKIPLENLSPVDLPENLDENLDIMVTEHLTKDHIHDLIVGEEHQEHLGPEDTSENPDNNLSVLAEGEEIFNSSDQSRSAEGEGKKLVVSRIEIKAPDQTRKKLNLQKLNDAIKEGEKANDDFTNANLKLVVSAVLRKYGYNSSTLDHIQEGNFGLLKAVNKYEWRRGFKFSTLASWWISQAIDRGAIDKDEIIRIPVHMRGDIATANRVRRELEQNNESNLASEDIEHTLSFALGWTSEKIGNIISASKKRNILSIDAPLLIKGEENERTIADVIPTDYSSPEKETEEHDITERVQKEIDQRLSEREARVLTLRFGLEDGRERSLDEVGKEFGVSRERIRQIEAKALGKLRHPDSIKSLEGYNV